VSDQREGGLLRWQWSLYPAAHRDRRNLAVHLITAPLFVAGTCVLLASPVLGWVGAPVGAAAMLVTVVAQGRGHKLEQAAPAPFRGPADVAARLFVEQWITFPRFVFSGRFVRAWLAAAAGRV
jgi:hypothetical protein